MLQISMPRGDMRAERFTLMLNNSPYIDLDEIFFTVKKSVNHKTPLIQKKLSNGTITLDNESFKFVILPEDTDDLDYGHYVFDIELVKAGEIKQTFVGGLELTSEVTFAENEVEEEPDDENG